MDMGLLTSLV